MLADRALRFSSSRLDSADWLTPTLLANSGRCHPSFSRRLRMAAPFWWSRPGALPMDARTSVVTVCVMLMGDNLESSDMIGKRNLVADSH